MIVLKTTLADRIEKVAYFKAEGWFITRDDKAVFFFI